MTDEEEQRIIDMKEAGSTYKQIVLATGKAYSTIHGVLFRAGYVQTRSKRSAHTKAVDAVTGPEVLKLRREGKTYLEISALLNIPQARVNRILRANGMTNPRSSD